MGFTHHVRLTCHTCKRRHVNGGPKKGGSWGAAQRVGWVFMVWSTLGRYI